jgi:hypothetical protein
MATQFTDSIASGYMTDVMWGNMGNKRSFMAHYSSPVAATGYVEVGFNTISYIHVQDADPTAYQLSANAHGGLAVYFSGLVVGSTGYMMIVS